MFRFAGVGGAANKNDRKFLGFAPRELVERGRGASVIRQNPADFVRNTFELCPIHTASWEMKQLARQRCNRQAKRANGRQDRQSVGCSNGRFSEVKL